MSEGQTDTPVGKITGQRGVAVGGLLASGAALFSAAACCVLPLVFVAMGIGATGLTAFVPYHWPLTIFAGLAVAAGWFLYLRKRSTSDTGKRGLAHNRFILVALSLATTFVVLSALWKQFFEGPLRAWLGG